MDATHTLLSLCAADGSCRFGIDVTFDLSGVHHHRYLGDVDDVNDGLHLLEEGHEYTIPSISRSGISHSPVGIRRFLMRYRRCFVSWNDIAFKGRLCS